MIDRPIRFLIRSASATLLVLFAGCSDRHPNPVASDFVLPIPGVSVCYADCPLPFLGEGEIPADSMEVTPPKLMNTEHITTLLDQWYPSELSRCCIRGSVVVWIYVQVSGKPTEVRLVESIGTPALDSLVVNVATATEFAPARVNQDAVPVWVVLPVIF